MITAWIAVTISAAVALGAAARAVWLGGRRDGTLDKILQQLTNIADDHEDRIRLLEGRRRRRS